MATQRPLFDSDAPATPAPAPAPRLDALVQRPRRHQAERRVFTLDDRVPGDHAVRAIEQVVTELDLTALDARIAAHAEVGGRPAIDPRIPLTLWLYATTEGLVHASELARRCQTDDIDRWVCGGVSVGERKLADFRARGGDVFDDLVTQVLVALMSEGLIDLHRTAQDGMRVRAWCGADSFRRHDTLETLLAEAKNHLQALQAQAHNARTSKVARVAAERGARQRVERLERAVRRVHELATGLTDEERTDKKKAPRALATDPEATRRKMADGGVRPAYNVPFDTAADGTGAIVGVQGTDQGHDDGQMTPMTEQVVRRTGRRPGEKRVDGGHVPQKDIGPMEKAGTKVFAPAPKKKADAAGRRANERTTEQRAFDERIESDEGKAAYAKRGEVAELSNAHARTRHGLTTLVLRGLKGAMTVALLVTLTKDVQVLVRERAARAAAVTPS
jgi:transposase